MMKSAAFTMRAPGIVLLMTTTFVPILRGEGAPDVRGKARLAWLDRQARALRFETARRPELRALLKEMLALQKDMGLPKRDRAETLFRLGEASWDRHTRYREVLPCHQAALELLDHAPPVAPGRHDELRDKILMGLVACRKDLGDREACRVLHEQIVALRRRGLGDEHRNVGWALWRLGSVEEQLGRLDAATGHLGEALRILEGAQRQASSKSDDSRWILSLRDQYRKLLARTGRKPSWFGADPKAREAERQKALLMKARSTPLAQGETPLHRAARFGLVEEIRRLVAAGADPNVRDGSDRPPLHHAAAMGDDAVQLEAARILLEAGADPNATSERWNYRPLQRAAEMGQVAMCRLLLDHGADPELRDAMARTPIYIAGYYGKVEVVKLLLAGGADPSAVSKGGARPLHVVCGGSPFAGQDEVVHALVKAGADVNARAEGGETPLLEAARFGRVDMAGILLSLGARSDLADERGRTPLSLARGKKDEAMMNLLLAHGAKK